MKSATEVSTGSAACVSSIGLPSIALAPVVSSLPDLPASPVGGEGQRCRKGQRSGPLSVPTTRYCPTLWATRRTGMMLRRRLGPPARRWPKAVVFPSECGGQQCLLLLHYSWFHKLVRASISCWWGIGGCSAQVITAKIKQKTGTCQVILLSTAFSSQNMILFL